MGKSFTYLLKNLFSFFGDDLNINESQRMAVRSTKKDINDFRKWLMKKNKVEMGQFLENNK